MMKGILINADDGTPLYGDMETIKLICEKCGVDCDWETQECMSKYVDYCIDYKGIAEVTL